jgi:hypothetical protein
VLVSFDDFYFAPSALSESRLTATLGRLPQAITLRAVGALLLRDFKLNQYLSPAAFQKDRRSGYCILLALLHRLLIRQRKNL